MWLLILAGLLAVSVGEETISNSAEKVKPSSDNAGDIVMLEIDVKEPVKRSPTSESAEYGVPSNQYILQSADGAQELPPEYLSVLQQYAQEAPQPVPQRRVQPAYAKQQQNLQQAYYNFRKPTVVPPRPRPQLHPQALAQADAAAELQAQVEAQNRADAIRIARLGSNPPSSSAYQQSSYAQPKLGTFEQELLQLVSANQAQEFKLLPTQPKGSTSAYAQQLVSYPAQYPKQSVATAQLPEQYHIETTPSRYQQQQQPQYQQPQYQQPIPSYQSVEEPVQYQAAKPVNAAPQYDYEDVAYQKALEQAQAQSHAQAEAQALAFQNIAQAEYKKYHLGALEQIRITNDRHRQQSALEQIQQGAQVSDAGRSHLQEQYSPKSAEAAYRAKIKAQAAAENAEARKLQQAAEFKAHADAIRKLEAQQQAHLKIQEQVHNYALNFEEHQMRAQAVAQAQAEALYKSQLQSKNQVKNEVLAIAKGQVQGKKVDTGLYHYTLSTTTPLPLLNNYFTNDQLQKYQASGSSHVPRSVPKPDDVNPVVESAQSHTQPAITQSHQSHKLKIPSQSLYVSESGILKKSPIKSITLDQVIQQDQISNRPVQAIASKERTLTEEDLSVLINAGYTVTPVSQTAKPLPTLYAAENPSASYYAKKQKLSLARPEYITYEEVIQRPHKLIRKNRPVPKRNEKEGDASEKITYLVPLEPVFGTRQPPLKQEE